MDLLKDICGSVNELKTEMGNSGREGKINLEEIESKLKYPQKFAELSEKSSKMEVECGFFKTQCQSLEEKYMEEKRKNTHLEDLIRDRENEIRQLNSYLKEAETFSKSVEQENRVLQMQLTESKSKLEQEIDRKDQLRSEFDINLGKVATLEDRLRSFEDKESKIVESAALSEKAKKDKNCGSDGEMELEVQGGQSARSTLSSKSAGDGALAGFEEKYKQEKESRSRLKQKTKLLLRQYRGKRSQLEKKERQLATQRSGLLKLQTLHQSVEANHCIVIHHLGQQIQQIANLVSTLWPGDDLSCLGGGADLGENKLSEWIVRIDSLSGWTISKLVKVSMSRRRGGKVEGEKEESGVDSSKDRKVALRAAAMKCELGIVDEGRTVERMISGLEEEEEEEGEDTDRQVGTWM